MSQIRWQCRRGMRELDELLLAYLEQRYTPAEEDEKAAFRALLALPDTELAAYLLQQRTPAAELAIVVQHILGRPDA